MPAVARLERALATHALAAGALLATLGIAGPDTPVYQPTSAAPLPRTEPVTRLGPKPTPPAGRWVAPLSGYRLTARFGASSGPWASNHTGLDLAAPAGTPIRSVTSGLVTEVAYDGAYGLRTTIRLEDGTELWYCHQNGSAVDPGRRVRPGTVIGTVGSSGNVTGPHLHLEVRPRASSPVDPYAVLAAHGVHL